MRAIDKVNMELGVKFSTYAVPMIIGEIRRFLRDNSSLRVSRSLRDTAYRSLQAREKLTRELDREPTIEEISAEIGLPSKNVAFSLDAISDTVSLNDPVYKDGSETVRIMDQISDEKHCDDKLKYQAKSEFRKRKSADLKRTRLNQYKNLSMLNDDKNCK